MYSHKSRIPDIAWTKAFRRRYLVLSVNVYIMGCIGRDPLAVSFYLFSAAQTQQETHTDSKQSLSLLQCAFVLST